MVGDEDFFRALDRARHHPDRGRGDRVVCARTSYFDSINSMLSDVIGGEGNSFDITTYFGTSRVIGFTMLAAVLNVVLLTALSTLAAFLCSLAHTLLGGIEVTWSRRSLTLNRTYTFNGLQSIERACFPVERDAPRGAWMQCWQPEPHAVTSYAGHLSLPRFVVPLLTFNGKPARSTRPQPIEQYAQHAGVRRASSGRRHAAPTDGCVE
ncbi:MAG: DUF3566 domain-containing protein [Marmoricola sp.]